MKLISMTDFVLEQIRLKNEKMIQYEKDGFGYEYVIDAESYFNLVVEYYANFLKQPLELWMFVAVDENGNVLEEPKVPHTFASENSDLYIKKWNKEKEEYQKAKERCLFEGFYVKDGIVYTPGNIVMVQKSLLEKITVENLLGYGYKLTPTAQKQIGL